MSPINQSVAEPLLRFAKTSLESADARILAIQYETRLTGQKHGAKLEAAQRRIAEAIEFIEGWAKANRVEIRESMKT